MLICEYSATCRDLLIIIIIIIRVITNREHAEEVRDWHLRRN